MMLQKLSGAPGTTNTLHMIRQLAAMLLVILTVLAAFSERLDAQSSAASTDAFPGRIEAMVRADVTAQVTGIVEEIHFEAGQTVKQGDVLFTLDDTEFLLQLDEAQANVERADVMLLSAKQEFERMEALSARGSVAAVQMLKAKGAQALAEAVLNQTQVMLAKAQSNLERSVIRAPLSGVISPARTEIGALAEPGSSKTLAQIVQLDPVRLAYQIPYVDRLRQLGISDLTDLEDFFARTTLRLQVTDTWVHPHETRPRHAAADVDAETGELTLWTEVENPRFLLRPGMQVTVLSTYNPE